MNTVEMFERAIRESLAQYAAEAVPVSWLHCASVPVDGDNATGLQRFPETLIAVGGKEHADDGVTWNSAITITCATLSEHDRDASILARMYEAVESFFEHLLTAEADDEIASHFSAVVRQTLPTFCLGGFTPMASDGVIVQEQMRLMPFIGTLHYEY